MILNNEGMLDKALLYLQLLIKHSFPHNFLLNFMLRILNLDGVLLGS